MLTPLRHPLLHPILHPTLQLPAGAAARRHLRRPFMAGPQRAIAGGAGSTADGQRAHFGEMFGQN